MVSTGPGTPHPRRRCAPQPLVLAFPAPGPRVRLAYRELHLAENGTPEQRKHVGHPELLPRPWDPGTCTDVELRLGLWEWFEAVVAWLNHQYFWDPTDMIPTCWPLHPHLVREVAVLADQRRRAGLETTSHSLEAWHRYALPAFTDRARERTRSYCEAGHQPWPGRSRHQQHTSPVHIAVREETYARDINATPAHHDYDHTFEEDTPRLYVLDLETGQVRGGGADGDRS